MVAAALEELVLHTMVCSSLVHIKSLIRCPGIKLGADISEPQDEFCNPHISQTRQTVGKKSAAVLTAEKSLNAV